MYQIYQFTVRDYLGNDTELKFRGPLLADDNARRTQMNRIRSRLHQTMLARVIFESYGWERVRNFPTLPPEATNDLVIKMGYTTQSNVDRFIEIPSPNMDIIDTIVGDLIDLSDNPIANLVSRLESETVDYASGETITFNYAVLTGTN